jgi:flagellar hook-length control protein FliK
MNIEGVNLSSLLLGNNAIELAGVQSFPEHGAIPEGFSNALMGQVALLSETNTQVELPGPLQNMTVPQTVNNGTDIGDLLNHKGNEQELAALFDKYLPLATEKNETVDLNEDVDLEATLLSLTNSLKAITPDKDATNPVSTSDEMATAQNMSFGLALTNSLKTVTPDSDSVNLVFTSDEVAAAQNRREVTALNGLSFVKPLPEETKRNMLGEEDVVSGDFLQKETVLRQPIQDKQGFNLPYVENTAPAEKTLVLEKQASIAGIEQAAPGGTSEINPFHRQVDNRTDGPVITRPLTHPGWGKGLGEQIVWMNNKAIPAAEIRLNPAHLGPISVRIDVNQDQATILFTAQHMEVKEAIEASIPKLREMLGTQQLNLVNVNISQNSTSDQGRSHYQTFAKTPENREQGIESVTGAVEEQNENDRVVVSKGLLSIYA